MDTLTFPSLSATFSEALSGETVCIKGGVYFGIGFALGWLTQGSVVMLGSLMAIRHIANSAILFSASFFARINEWRESSFFFASALSTLLISAAIAVAAIALNFFTPLSAAIYFGFDLFFAAIDLGHGIVRRAFKIDRSFHPFF